MNLSRPENRAIFWSILAATLMLTGKVGAWWITGSVAILSDAAESIIHIFATGLAGLSLWYAQRPADKTHPYGHGKIAYFSAGLEGALIFMAGLIIIWIGVEKMITGVELRQLDIGLAITAALCAINLWLGLYLIRTGKATHSLIVIANGKHVLTDMWTSLGVLVGVGAVWLTGVLWLDPLVGIVMGANILVTAGKLIWQAQQGLLDHADPEITQQLIDFLNEEVRGRRLAGFHQLRHRRSDRILWIELHLLFDEQLSIRAAHQQATQIENSLRRLFPGLDLLITSHLEPSPHRSAHPHGHPENTDPLNPQHE